jgi:prepilin-type N-terminal cleavage/methylation domain-containing protein
MHRIWKALRDRRGFTLIEIAIVIAIIGILLLIALPLFTGARTRAYVAEARQVASEWKALEWSCLVEKNFKAEKCDTFSKVGWTKPINSEAWQWTGDTNLICGDDTDFPIAVATTTCTADDDTTTWFGIRVATTGDVSGLTQPYLLVLRTDNGLTAESAANGVPVEDPTP